MKNKAGLVIAIALILLSALPLTPVSAKPAGAVKVQILAINDFHGHLKPPTGSSGEIGAVPAGGAVINRKTGQVVHKAARNRIVDRTVAKDSAITDLIRKYDAVAAPLANRVMGAITADITRSPSPAGESALGDVIADGQLYATAGAESGAAVVAFTNPGGIRADLVYLTGTGEGDGKVTYEEIFNTQPFVNNLVTMTLTGGQIHALLEQQFKGCYGQTGDRILQVSAGFAYSWSPSGPACDKVAMDSIRIRGAPINLKASYRVTVNAFLAEGGDNFTVLQDGADRLVGVRDIDALAAYLKALSPVAPGPQDRITRLD